MRLRSPAENYIKYLACHPDKLDTSVIRNCLIDAGLDFISDGYIEGLRAKLRVPDPFFPGNPGHPASFGFIVHERINRMFQPDVATKMALELLAAPRAKEFVEAMLLAHVPPSAIASFVTKHRSVCCSVEALEVYTHYFWNIDLLDSTQMRVLLQLRIDTAADNVPELKDKKKVLTNAYWKDPRKVAADLPYSPTTAMLAQMRLGMKPTKSEIALRMLETRDIAWIRAAEAAQQDGPGDSQKFLNYANGGRILEELLQMVVKPEDHLRDQLSAITLRTELKTVPSIHELSAGQHTTELAPIKDISNVEHESDPERESSHVDGGG
jgi:hypothetical protein